MANFLSDSQTLYPLLSGENLHQHFNHHISLSFCADVLQSGIINTSASHHVYSSGCLIKELIQLRCSHKAGIIVFTMFTYVFINSLKLLGHYSHKRKSEARQ